MKTKNLAIMLAFPLLFLNFACDREIENAKYVGKKIKKYPGPCFMQYENDKVSHVFSVQNKKIYFYNPNNIALNLLSNYNIEFSAFSRNIKSAEEVK